MVKKNHEIINVGIKERKLEEGKTFSFTWTQKSMREVNIQGKGGKGKGGEMKVMQEIKRFRRAET